MKTFNMTIENTIPPRQFFFMFIAVTLDNNSCTVLVMLDLSSAFDVLDNTFPKLNMLQFRYL